MFIQLTQKGGDIPIPVNTDQIAYILPGDETGSRLVFPGPAIVEVAETPADIMAIIAEEEFDEDFEDDDYEG